jgi:hypothetical protein
MTKEEHDKRCREYIKRLGGRILVTIENFERIYYSTGLDLADFIVRNREMCWISGTKYAADSIAPREA